MRLKSAMHRSLFLVFFFFTIVTPAHAADLYVGACASCTYPTIGAAVADSVAGDRVFVSGGVYNESVDLNTMDTQGNIQLIANGSVTINPLPGAPGIKYDQVEAGITKFNGNISIDGFSITAQDTAIYLNGIAGDVSITDCVFNNLAGTGALVNEADGNVTIRQCTGNNVTGLGILVNIAGGNVLVEDCNTDNFVGIGIWVQNAAGNVSVMGCNTSHGMGIGVWIQSANGDLTIQYCNINDNTNGLFIDGLSAAGSNSVMCNNISGNEFSGLDISNGTFTLDATENWWGDASGPAPAGSGNAITENPSYTGDVSFDPWLQGPFESAAGCRAESIPSINEWGMILLAMLVAAAALWGMKGVKSSRNFT